MRKLLALSLAIIVTLTTLMTGCGNIEMSGGNVDTREELLTSVKQMIKHVYSPETVEEYNNEALIWVEKMQNGTHKEMFEQYPIGKLTEKDLDRVITFEYITYGKAEMQADGKECVLALFGVSNVKTMATYWIEVELQLDEDANIIDMSITAK